MISDREWQANVDKCMAYMHEIGGLGMRGWYGDTLKRALHTARALNTTIVVHRSPTECRYGKVMHKECDCRCCGVFDYALPDGYVIH